MTKLIKNKPCNEDLFEGRSHERLAEVIARYIKNDGYRGLIGIDGGWGSGKSNLVGMIETKLNKDITDDKKYHFFTYDAWAHQNDLPRRTILEEMVEYLTSPNKPFDGSKKWSKRLDNLLAKKKETSTKTVPSLGAGFIIAILIAIVTPVSKQLCLYLTHPWGLVISVLLYVIVVWFALARHSKKMTEKYGQKPTTEQFVSELFLIYADKVNEETKHEVLIEREPTSRSFKKWMSEISEELNTEHLVIVIDNMDRLPKTKVQELWATIHSIFTDIELVNIRVIIPFDREHIKCAFQSEDIYVGEQNSECVKENIIYGNDFINKTFQVVYRVAPPILSGWKDYFKHMWNEAFGPEAELDEAILQIYDMLTKEHSPRKIIAFINEFVTIKEIAEREIEDKYIALFIFGKESISSDPIKEILDPSFLGSLDFIYKADNRMKQCLSSLYYQLPVQNAMDVVFVRTVTQELDNNALHTLPELKGTPKFWTILDHSIVSVTNIPNAVKALDALFNEDSLSSNINRTWSSLYNKFVSQFTGISQYEDYHSVLLSHIVQKNEMVKLLINSYFMHLDSSVDIKGYTNGIDELEKVEGANAYQYLRNVHKEITPEKFVEFVSDKKESFHNYGLICNADELDSYLHALELDKYKDLSVIPYILGGYELPNYKQRIKQSISENTNDVSKVMYLIKRLHEIEEAPIDINTYLPDSELHTIISNVSDTDSDFYNELLAMVISRFSNYEYSSNSYSYVKLISSMDDERSIDIASKIQKYTTFGEILQQLKSYSHNDTLRLIAKELLLNGKNRKLTILPVLKCYAGIIENSNIQPSEFWNCIDEWYEDRKSISVEHIPQLPIELYVDIQTVDSKLGSYLLDLVNQYMASISQEEWGCSLKNEDYNYELYISYHPEHYQSLVDAVKKDLKEYAQNASYTPLKKDVVDEILGALASVGYNIDQIVYEVRNIFIQSSSMDLKRFVYFGDLLFMYGNLKNKQGALKGILPTEILEEDSVLTIIKNNKELFKELLASTSDADKTEHLAKLKALINGKYADDTDIIDLAKLVGV